MPDALIALALIAGAVLLVVLGSIKVSSRESRQEEMHSKDPIGWVPEEDANE